VRGSGRTELHIAPGGIDSLRSRLLGPSMGLAPLGQRRRCSKTLPAFLCGQPVRCALSLSNWLSPVVEPRSGILIPPQACNMRKKSPHFHASSSLNMAVRGGLTRFARGYSAHPWASPLWANAGVVQKRSRRFCAGSLFAALSVCPTGCRQLSNPGRGFSSPPSRRI
jgi:hypothetical protein